jgi:hypothetical protein
MNNTETTDSKEEHTIIVVNHHRTLGPDTTEAEFIHRIVARDKDTHNDKYGRRRILIN